MPLAKAVESKVPGAGDWVAWALLSARFFCSKWIVFSEDDAWEIPEGADIKRANARSPTCLAPLFGLAKSRFDA
jgi:hypothetical protein